MTFLLIYIFLTLLIPVIDLQLELWAALYLTSGWRQNGFTLSFLFSINRLLPCGQ